MGSTVIAARIYDKDLIKGIMTRPDIWATIAEDGQDPVLFDPNTCDECWLLMSTEKGEIVGLYNIHGVTAVTAEIHAQVLPEYRKQYSRECGVEVLRWLYEFCPGYLKYIANIPTIYDNVKNYTLTFGFMVEGVNRMSYLKNGILCDQWMLGITREEIGAFLDEQSC